LEYENARITEQQFDEQRVKRPHVPSGVSMASLLTFSTMSEERNFRYVIDWKEDGVYLL
jgi:hypothetical protein